MWQRSFDKPHRTCRLGRVTKPTKGLGCLVLFSLPFAIGGLAVAFMAGLRLWNWADVRDWQEVPARILEARLEEHRGDDSTTYEVVASYEYQFAGLTYQGDRVGLGSGGDNIGSFHQDKYRELESYRSQDRPFRCYVDPDDPSRSLLYRQARWGLLAFMGLFSLLFCGAGFGLMFAGLWGKRKLEQEQNLTVQHPGEPWRWKQEWGDGRIASAGKARFLLPTIMAVFWNLISTPLIFVIPREVLDKQNYLALIALVFPLVGVGLAVWAGRSFVRWKKFGDSVFEMSTFPGVIGGRLAGRVLTSVDLDPSTGFLVKLSNINRVTTGSGDNRSTSERILWQDERHLLEETAQYDSTRSEIPVDFAIPHEASPTEERSDDDEILWRLQVSAEVPGVDFDALFEIPVFMTDESRPESEIDDASEPWGGSSEPTMDLGSYGIDSELMSTGGQRLTFRAGRHRGTALVLTAFLLIWLGINYLLLALDAPLFFPIIWGLFSLLLLFGTLDLWFERRSVEVHPDHLAMSGGIFGLGKTIEVPRSAIQEITPVRGMQSGNKLFYRIQIRTRDDKKHIAATKLDNLSLARHIVDLLTP